MKYFNAEKPLRLKLTRDLTKHLKRGNPWIFSDALEKLKAPEGSYTILVSHKNEILAHGFYSPNINLAFRVLNLGDKKFNDFDKGTIIFNKPHYDITVNELIPIENLFKILNNIIYSNN